MPLITSGIEMEARNLAQREGAIFHSDRGGNYTSAGFARCSGGWESGEECPFRSGADRTLDKPYSPRSKELSHSNDQARPFPGEITRLVPRSSRHLSRRAVKPGVIGPEGTAVGNAVRGRIIGDVARCFQWRSGSGECPRGRTRPRRPSPLDTPRAP